MRKARSESDVQRTRLFPVEDPLNIQGDPAHKPGKEIGVCRRHDPLSHFALTEEGETRQSPFNEPMHELLEFSRRKLECWLEKNCIRILRQPFQNIVR